MTITAGATITSIPSPAVGFSAAPASLVVAEPSPSPAGGNGTDAVAVADMYEEAFARQDCDLFAEVTTRAFRERIGLNECDRFIASARGRADVIESIAFTPVSTGGMGRGAMGALLHVELQSLLDEDGQQVDSSVQLDYDYRYHFVRSDGTWKIDDVHDVTGGRTEGQLTAEEEEAVAPTMAEWRVAYSTGNCDALQASTTGRYRETMGWTDCATFEQHISDQNAYCPMDVHQEDIRFLTRVGGHVGEIEVDVVQVCTVDTDEFGNPIEPPYQAGVPYRYHLVEADGTWKIASEHDGAAAEDEPANTNERAAVETMRAYNDAWRDADCAAYLATTAEGLRIGMNIADCATFTPAAQGYSEAMANFTLTPTDIERPSATRMEIKSHETYDSLTDADGQPVDPPFPVDEYWVYTLVLVDGSWVISDFAKLL